MKTFNDLKFVKHPNYGIGKFDKQATINFKNNYGVSVITGGYGNNSRPYEVAILFDNDLTYSTYITDDVIGYQTEEDVTIIMRKVQEL